jgi:GDP-L-fucose synthase
MNKAEPGVPFDLTGKRVWVAGHRGMVGSAIVRRLAIEQCEILTVDRDAVDLRRQSEVETWLQYESPDVIFIAAATVGGILANSSRPAEFLYDNLAIETNIIHGATNAGIEKLLFMGSSCIYPKMSEQPIKEEALLSGPLEATNEAYAIAKIVGIKLCENYRRQHGHDFVSVMPTSLYGPGDNFDPQQSHVIPALLVRAHKAKADKVPEMEIWGTGSPLREFLHVDDMADALVFLMKNYSDEICLNIGSGIEVSIMELVEAINKVVGFEGKLSFDTSKPDGTPRKLLDSGRLKALGWQSQTGLVEGLEATYQWYLDHVQQKH